MNENQLPGVRRVLLAAPRSFCAGVERAIDVVEHALTDNGPPVYVRKQIVHNAHVVADLEARGAVFVEELDDVPPESLVIFSAHGVSPQVREQAATRNLRVIDATCPLVSKVHARARRLQRRGDTVVLIGHAGHEEVEGTLGHAPEVIQLVEHVEDVDRVVAPDASRVTYLTQTTLAVDETTEIIARLRERFPDLIDPPTSDICYATTNRQQAIAAVAAQSELVLVVGSDNSSNSQRLVDVARSCGASAHLIDDAAQISPDWLNGVRTIGLSAGASAPSHLVDGVIARLRQFGPLEVDEYEFTRETVHFATPATRKQP
ncbi:4-hydroxy-3-methylbut-2-enyl diphosphate reductase [Mycolicibacterium goodii]|uniref:4-hydroxy-3-methylbut-2-enyl diphosphate reductase n=1 Tax=Mycolicibacterium goodii TaxID=134601 RepID=A0A0K0X0Q3_MYCGD|nr:4-hydroxy-3-methylbut-2-enyl diphosphate reductase [Mycolicibacterium goodii]